jgi:hypothetical protein
MKKNAFETIILKIETMNLCHKGILYGILLQICGRFTIGGITLYILNRR